MLAGAAALTMAIGAGAALAAPGDLDLSFDGDGRRAIDAGGDDRAYGLALRGNGKIGVVGFGSPNINMIATQLNTNGSTDTTFGTGGSTNIDFGGAESGSVMTLQSDGSAILVGHTAGADVDVARLTPTGVLDNTFSGDGKVTFDWNQGVPAASIDEAHGAVVQTDGKILIVGYSDPSTGFAIARLNSNGTLDTTFSGDGIAKVTFNGAEQARAVALQPDGKIVVVGTTGGSASGDIAVARLDTAGNLDPTFSTDGRVVVGAGGNDQGYSVAIQVDGKIVIGGFGTPGQNFVVARLNADGSQDTTFDVDGVANVDFGGADRGRAIALQANGKVVIVGETTKGNDVALARLQPGGALDTSFSGDGRTIITTPGDDDVLAVALAGDGNIVYAGSTSVGKNMLIGRVEGDGPVGGGPAPTFGAVGAGPSTNVPVTTPALLCRGKQATVIGSPKADTLRGTSGADVIVGLGGNDKISGLGGNDVICAGAGNDRVLGGAGGDTLLGGKGKDVLIGGAGVDLMLGQNGRDRFLSGAGRDTAAGGAARDTYVGKTGNDKLISIEVRLK